MVVHSAVRPLMSDLGHDSLVFCRVDLFEIPEEIRESYGEVHVEDTGVRKLGLRSRFEPISDSLREGWKLEWIAWHVELSDGDWLAEREFVV